LPCLLSQSAQDCTTAAIYAKVANSPPTGQLQRSRGLLSHRAVNRAETHRQHQQLQQLEFHLHFFPTRSPQ
jgi:hypothetical protein